MSRNEVSENLINHYLEPKKGKRTPTKSINSTKKSGQSLKEFYNEVQQQSPLFILENIYNVKSAVEIEQMMVTNRQLIEANYTKH